MTKPEQKSAIPTADRSPSVLLCTLKTILGQSPLEFPVGDFQNVSRSAASYLCSATSARYAPCVIPFHVQKKNASKETRKGTREERLDIRNGYRMERFA